MLERYVQKYSSHYQLELSDESKKFVVEYFEKNKNENKVVNKKNFADG